ncbi:MAG: class I SAM-dependent methyltransferase [Sphingobium sp.]
MKDGSASGTRSGSSSPEGLRMDRLSPAHRDFERLAREAGMDPDNRWVGGYADYEWSHLRLVLAAYGVSVQGKDVLEFGCNVGASSVVLAALGARLAAVDIDAGHVAIARANLARHGVGDGANILHVEDTRAMPFAPASFDFILANSVLEYVDPRHLDSVIAQLHRLLRPGGRLLICGTASRIAVQEIHSGRWLVNYLPRMVDRIRGKPLQRGLGPMHLAASIRGRFSDVTGSGWLAGRKAIHGRASLPMRAVARFAALLGRSPGWFTPHIELLLEKRD